MRLSEKYGREALEALALESVEVLIERLASFELELNGLMRAKEEKGADVFARFAEILVMLKGNGSRSL